MYYFSWAKHEPCYKTLVPIIPDSVPAETESKPNTFL